MYPLNVLQFLDLSANDSNSNSETESDLSQDSFIDDDTEVECHHPHSLLLPNAKNLDLRRTNESQQYNKLPALNTFNVQHQSADHIASSNLIQLKDPMWELKIKKGKEVKTAEVIQSNLEEHQSVLHSILTPRRLFVVIATKEELLQSWSRSFPARKIPKIRLLSEEEQSEIDSMLATPIDFTDIFRLNTWVKVKRGEYRGSHGVISQVRINGQIDVTVIRKEPEFMFSNSKPVSQTVFGKEESADDVNRLETLRLTPFKDTLPAAPTIADVKDFIHTPVDLTEISNKCLCIVNDTIIITQGTFIGLTANVVDIDSKTATVSIERTGTSGHAWFASLPHDHYKRVFHIGQHVVENLGVTDGAIGTVVKVADNDLTVIFSEPLSEFLLPTVLVKTAITESDAFFNPSTQCLDKVFLNTSIPYRLTTVEACSSSNIFLVKDIQSGQLHTVNASDLIVPSTCKNLLGATPTNEQTITAFLRQNATLLIGNLPTAHHNIPQERTTKDVYIANRRFKQFGKLLYKISNEFACVKLDNENFARTVSSDDVVSLSVILKLTIVFKHTHRPPYRVTYKDLNGRPFIHANLLHDVWVNRENMTNFKTGKEVQPGSEACSSELPFSTASHIEGGLRWLMHETAHEIMTAFCIVLRFVEHCDRPMAVGGRICWTGAESVMKTFSTNGNDYPTSEIFLHYKTSDGRRRSALVPIRNIEECIPRVKEPVIVIGENNHCTIMYCGRLIRGKSGSRHITAVDLFSTPTLRGFRTTKSLDMVSRLVKMDADEFR